MTRRRPRLPKFDRGGGGLGAPRPRCGRRDGVPSASFRVYRSKTEAAEGSALRGRGGADVVTKPKFAITFHIRPEAKWSDNVPLTADDFIFTWKTFVNPKWDIVSRNGWDQIASAKKINAKTVQFVY